MRRMIMAEGGEVAMEGIGRIDMDWDGFVVHWRSVPSALSRLEYHAVRADGTEVRGWFFAPQSGGRQMVYGVGFRPRHVTVWEVAHA
jgi:hypothetical protein